MTAAGPLPKLAVSLPAGVAPAEAARLVRACGSDDVLIVLAPTVVRIGDGADTPARQPPQPTSPRRPTSGFVSRSPTSPPPAAIARHWSSGRSRTSSDFWRSAGPRWPASSSSRARRRTPRTSSSSPWPRWSSRPGAPRPDLVIALDAPEGPARPRLLAYADAVVLSSDSVAATEPPGIDSITAGRPLTMRVSVGGTDSGRGGSDALLGVLTTGHAAAASTVWFELPGLAALRGLCTTMQALARTLGAGFEMTAAERAPAAVLVDGRPASTAVAFVSSQAADVAVLLRSGGSREAPRTLSLAAAAHRQAAAGHLRRRGRRAPPRRQPGEPPPRAAPTPTTSCCVARAPAGGDRLFEQVSVTGRAALRVEEIIARWQAAREAERLAARQLLRSMLPRPALRGHQHLDRLRRRPRAGTVLGSGGRRRLGADGVSRQRREAQTRPGVPAAAARTGQGGDQAARASDRREVRLRAARDRHGRRPRLLRRGDQAGGIVRVALQREGLDRRRRLPPGPALPRAARREEQRRRARRDPGRSAG